MKNLGVFVVLFGLLLITGCTTYQPIAPGIAPIVLKAAETRPIGIGVSKATLPAGEYKPDFQSKTGVYYLAPTSVVSSGLAMSSAARGGLFVPLPSEKDQRQGVWIQMNIGGSALELLVTSSSGTGTVFLSRFDDPIVF